MAGKHKHRITASNSPPLAEPWIRVELRERTRLAAFLPCDAGPLSYVGYLRSVHYVPLLYYQ